MKISELIISNGLPQKTTHTFPLILYCLRSAANGRDPLPFDVCYGAAGLLFANLWYKNNTHEIYDIVSLPNNIINSMDRIFSASGFDYEIASKWGGVYTEDYFLRRICEHLRLNQPSLILPSSPGSEAYCVTGINDKLKHLYVITSNGNISALGNWYEKLDSLLLIGRPARESCIKMSCNFIHDIFKYSFSWVNNIKNGIHQGIGSDIEALTYCDLFCNININPEILLLHIRFLSECRNAAVHFLQRFLQEEQSHSKYSAVMEIIQLYQKSASLLRTVADDQIQYDRRTAAKDLDYTESKAISLINEVFIKSGTS